MEIISDGMFARAYLYSPAHSVCYPSDAWLLTSKDIEENGVRLHLTVVVPLVLATLSTMMRGAFARIQPA